MSRTEGTDGMASVTFLTLRAVGGGHSQETDETDDDQGAFWPDYDPCEHCGMSRCLHPVDVAMGWPVAGASTCPDFEPPAHL